MPSNQNNDADLRFNAVLEDNVSPRVDAIITKMKQLGASKAEIKVFIRAYDEASAKAAHVKKQLEMMPKEVKSRITVDTSKAHHAISELRKAAEKPINVAIRLEQNLDQEYTKVKAKIHMMKTEFEQTFATMPAMGVFRSVGSTASSFGLSAAGLGGAGAGAASVMFARQAFQQNAQMEQDTVALKSVLKDVSAARTEMQNVTRFARRTPFNAPDVLQSDIMMRSFAINPKGPVGLTQSGNLAAAFGRSQQEATHAIVDAVRRGDFRMLGGFGINLRMEDFAPGGRYQGQSIQGGLSKLIGQRFGGAMDAQAKTFTGLTSNLQDAMNLGVIRPSGATGFGIVKGIENQANTALTGSGPQALQFQRELGKITQSIDHMSAKLFMAAKQTGTYFKTYMQTPLTDFGKSLKEIGLVFGEAFGASSLSVLKTYASGLAVVSHLASEISNAPIIGGSAKTLVQIKGFAKGLEFMGMGKTAKPFDNFANDTATLHFVKAMKDVLGMAAQAPKLAAFFTIKHILEYKAATDSLNASFAKVGNNGEASLDRVKRKLDQMGMTMNENVTVLKQFAAEVAKVLPPGTKGFGGIVLEGTKNLAALKGAGYGGGAQQLAIDEFKRMGANGYHSGDFDRATKNVVQSIDAISHSLGVDLKKAASDLANAMSVYADQLNAAKGEFGNNPTSFASMLQQISGLTDQKRLSKSLLTGSTPLGEIHNGDEFSKALGTMLTRPSTDLLKWFHEKDPQFKISSIQQFRTGQFDVWNGMQRNGRNVYTSEGQRTRDLLTSESDLEKTRRQQLKQYDADINRLMNTGRRGPAINVSLPKPASSFFQNQVGIRVGAMTSPDATMKEWVRLTNVVEQVTKASEQAQTKLAQLQVQQVHLDQAQGAVNFKFQNFQRALVPLQRSIQNQTLDMNNLAFNGMRPLEREVTRLNNTMAVYQHDHLLPIQRAQEDFSHSILKTTYALEDVNHRMQVAQFNMSKYADNLLPGENAMQQTLHDLDMYSKKLQLLQLQQRGMMADITKTTFTEGFKTTIKPLMGFSLERQQQLLEMKQQRTQLESDIKYGNQRWEIDRAKRSRFQRTERPFEGQLAAATKNQKVIDDSTVSSFKLQQQQYHQSVQQRKLTDAMYAAQVGMRKFEDQQFSLSQKMFRLNERLQNMQDNITKTNLALEDKSRGARKYEDALDRLRHAAFNLNKELIATQLLVGQLDTLPDVARQQAATVADRLFGGVTGQGPQQLRKMLEEFHKTGIISDTQYKAYVTALRDPGKEAAKSFKDEMNNSIASIAMSAKRLFSGLFTGNTGIDVGSAVSNRLNFLPGHSLVGGAAGLGVTAFGWNAMRLGLMRSLGLGVRGLSHLPGIRAIEGGIGTGLANWRDSSMPSPGFLNKMPREGIGPLNAWGRYLRTSAPMATLTHPFAVAGGKGVEGLTAVGLNALGVPLPFALLGGGLAGYGYESMGGGLGSSALRRSLGIATGGLYTRLPKQLIGPGRIHAIEQTLSHIPGPVGRFFDPEGTAMTRLRKSTGIGIDFGKEARIISEKVAAIRSTISNAFGAVDDVFGKDFKGALQKLRVNVAAATGWIPGGGGAGATAGVDDLAGSQVLDQISRATKVGTAAGAGARGLGRFAGRGLQVLGKFAMPAVGALTAFETGNAAAALQAMDPTALLGLIPGLGKFKGLAGSAFDILGIGTGKSDTQKISEKFGKFANITARDLTSLSKNFSQDPIGNLRQQIEKFQNLRISTSELDTKTQKQVRAAIDKEIQQRRDAIQKIQDAQNAAHKALKDHEMLWTNGMYDVREGVNRKNKKQTQKGYQEIADATGLSLDEIRSLTHKKGLKTGAAYAAAIKAGFKKHFGSTDMQEILDPAFNAQQNLTRGKDKEIAAIQALRRMDPAEYQKRLIQINQKYADANNQLTGQQATANTSEQKRLAQRFSDIEKNTKDHLTKLAVFQDAYTKTRKDAETTNWQDVLKRRTDAFTVENNDWTRHFGSVNKLTQSGWQDIVGTTDTFFSKVRKQLKSIDHLTFDSQPGNPVGDFTNKKAHGGVVGDRTTLGKGRRIIVGEEGHPEVVIPLAPHRRDRAISLMKQTAGHLGVMGGHEKFANGGLVSQVPLGGVHPAILAFASKIEQQYPGLTITSGLRNGGGHSYHDSGMAVDIAGGYPLMNKAAAWILSSGMASRLTEGIHNPNLSIKYGKTVPAGFWDAGAPGTWAAHANHIHVAFDDLHGNVGASGIASLLGGLVGGGDSAAFPHVPKKLTHMGVIGRKLYKALQSKRRMWSQLGGGGLGADITAIAHGGDKKQFAKDLLRSLGIQATPQDIAAIMKWENQEGGHWNNSAHFNPLNTTMAMPGATSMNSVGVKAYKNWQQGMQATVNTLNLPAYAGILAALRSGKDTNAVLGAISHSPWGTHFANGGYAWGGWNAKGGAFTANRPTLMGVGEKGSEHVDISPAGSDSLMIKLLREIATYTKDSADVSRKQLLTNIRKVVWSGGDYSNQLQAAVNNPKYKGIAYPGAMMGGMLDSQKNKFDQMVFDATSKNKHLQKMMGDGKGGMHAVGMDAGQLGTLIKTSPDLLKSQLAKVASITKAANKDKKLSSSEKEKIKSAQNTANTTRDKLEAAKSVMAQQQAAYVKGAKGGVSDAIIGQVLTGPFKNVLNNLSSDKQLTAMGATRGYAPLTSSAAGHDSKHTIKHHLDAAGHAVDGVHQIVKKAKAVTKTGGYLAAPKADAASVRGTIKSEPSKTPEEVRKLRHAMVNSNTNVWSKISRQIRHSNSILNDILDALGGASGGPGKGTKKDQMSDLTPAGQKRVKAWEKKFDHNVDHINKTQGNKAAQNYVKGVIAALKSQGAALKAHLTKLTHMRAELHKALDKAKKAHNATQTKAIVKKLHDLEAHIRDTKERIKENHVKAQHARNKLHELQKQAHKDAAARHHERGKQHDKHHTEKLKHREKLASAAMSGHDKRHGERTHMSISHFDGHLKDAQRRHGEHLGQRTAHHGQNLSDRGTRHRDSISSARDRHEDGKAHHSALRSLSSGEHTGRHRESVGQRQGLHDHGQSRHDARHGESTGQRERHIGHTRGITTELGDDSEDTGGTRGRLKSIYRRLDHVRDHLTHLMQGFRSVYPSRGFAGGMRYVPEDNYAAMLHKGEMVLQAGEAQVYRAHKAGTAQSLPATISTRNTEMLLKGVLQELRALNNKDTSPDVNVFAQGASIKTNVPTISRRTR